MRLQEATNAAATTLLKIMVLAPRRPSGCVVRFRQACVSGGRFIPGSKWGSLSPAFAQQGIHIIADTVPEVVADGTYLIEPGDQGTAVAGR